MKSHNTIEINGRLYDAHTGQPLNAATRKQTPVKKSSVPKSLDGFHATKKTVTPAKKPKTTIAVTSNPQTPVKAAAAMPVSPRPARAPAPSLKLKPKHSTTLHRQAVKKPALTQTHAQNEPAASEKKAPKLQVPKHTAARLERAQHIEKSAAISHFTHRSQPSKPESVAAQAPVRTSSITNVKPAEGPTPKSTKEQLITRAISQAVAQHHTEATHETKHKKKPRAHFMRYASSAALVLVLGAYVAYLNVPSISMKVAAHRAGFAAAFPGYKPAGYSLSGPIAYSPGQVTINFGSNTDSRRFSLKQQPTTWDSTALLENYVTKQTPNYLTYQDRGLTIYIFNGSSAAWVNGGKLYKLEGQNSQLDTDQLLKLATSV